MNRSRRLLASQNAYHRGYDRRNRWRHGEARPDRQWKQNEDNQEVRDSLERVVSESVLFPWPFQTQMVRKNPAQFLPLQVRSCRQHLFREVVCKQSSNYVDQASEYGNPSSQEMEIAPWATDRYIQYKWQRKIDEGWASTNSCLAPVQPRMRKEHG